MPFLPVVFDVRTQTAQTVQQGLHRSRVRLLVAVEPHRTIGEQHQWGHKAHHCAGEPAIDIDITVEYAVGGRGDGDVRRVIVVLRARHTERAQCPDHELGVARTQQAADMHRLRAQCGEDEETIRQRFAARNGDGGVKRPFGERRRPRLGIMFGHRLHRNGNG